MGLTRTEIELLINARNNAQAALTQLNDQVVKVTGSTKDTNEELGKFSQRNRDGGVAAQAAAVAVGMLAERMARGLVGAFQESIQAANKLDSGLIGLSATASAFKQDAGKATDAAKDLAADGLMSVGDSAAGLKNLLAAGFGLPEAVTLMNRFKDSAAFGRQGALAFGESIVGATEGIKNGNSALVDNAGVTKNLSVILQEAGLSANDLQKASSDVNVRMAIFNGILRETNPQLGNTNLFLKTAAGAQTQFSSQVTITEQKLGKALQPALLSVLGALTPFVQVAGNAANVLVPLGAALAAIVVPMAAMKASAAVGLTPALTGVTGATRDLIGAMSAGGIKTLGDFRAGIQLAGESAGVTTKSLGTFGTVAAVAGAAFVGWQIGKVIDQLTGASSAVEKFTYDVQRMAGYLGNDLKLMAEQAAAKQDVLARATQAAGRTITDYSEAIRINTAVVQIRQAQFDKSTTAQRAAIEAELLLGKITKEQANVQLAVLAAEDQVATVRASRMKLTDAVATAEKAYQNEIKATGYTETELIKILKDNENGFTTWAKQVQLSDGTIKRLKDSLTEHNKVAAKAAEASKKHAEALLEIQSAGDGWKGTLAGINPVLAETVKKLLESGVSAQAVGLQYKLTDTQVKALTKSIEEEKTAHEKVVEANKKHTAALTELASVGDSWQGTLAGMTSGMVEAIKGYLDAGVSQSALAEAYGLTNAQITAVTKSLADQKKIQEITTKSQQETADLMEEFYGLTAARAGSTSDEQIAAIERWKQKEIGQLKDSDENWQAHYDAIVKVATEKTGQVTNQTRIELGRQARDAEQHYQDLLAIFGPYAANVVEAHKKMVEAEMAEAGKLPSYWKSNVLPGITQAIQGIESGVATSFANMLTGAQGFGEGMKGVWTGIKKSVTDILADILNQFINSFLKGMLGAVLGQQGAFSGAFAGLMGGAGGAGGLTTGAGGSAAQWALRAAGIGGTSAAAGGAAVSSQVAATAASVDALSGGASAGAGVAGGLGAALAGGALAGGAGIGMGLLGKKIFGGAGWKAGTFGAASGAATGATIGSVVPGIGTLAGMGVGALAGALSGWLGKGAGRKEVENFVKLPEIGGFAGLQAKLAAMGDEGAKMWVKITQGVGKTDAKGAKQVIQEVADALDRQADKQREATKALDEATAADKASQAQVAEKQKVVDEIKGQMGSLDDQLKKWDEAEAPEEAMGLVEAEARAKIEAEKKVLAEKQKAADDALKAAQDAAEATAQAYKDAAAAAQAAFNDVKFPTPPNYGSGTGGSGGSGGSGGGGGGGEGGGDDGGDGGGGRSGRAVPEGRAAGGVMASRPGLVLFGEGGEPEVGGPASFFEKIFNRIGVSTGGGGLMPSAGGGPIQMVMDQRVLGEIMMPTFVRIANDLGLLPGS